MRKLTNPILLLLINLYGTVDALAYVSPTLNRAEFIFGGAGLHWQPSVSESDYALTSGTVTDLGLVSDGTFHTINPGYNWNYQAFIGLIFPGSKDDIRLTYTKFKNGTNSETSRLVNGELLPTLTDNWPASATLAIGGVEVIEFTVPPGFTQNSSPALPFELIAPSTISISLEPNIITARTEFKHSAVDLELGKKINVGRNWELRLASGVRYVNINETLDTTYSATGTEQATLSESQSFSTFLTSGFFVFTATPTVTATSTTNVSAEIDEVFNQKSTFEGVGPRVGFTSTYHFGGSGLGIVAAVDSSLIIGNTRDSSLDAFTSIFTATNTFSTTVTDPTFFVTGATITGPGEIEPQITTTGERIIQPSELRVVPNIDAKLALSLSVKNRYTNSNVFEIEAGWLVTQYFNALDRLSVINTQTPDLRTKHTMDASFAGPYVSLCVHI